MSAQKKVMLLILFNFSNIFNIATTLFHFILTSGVYIICKNAVQCSSCLEKLALTA